MKPLTVIFHFTTSLALGWLTSFPATAQITPDATLPNNSVLNIQGQVQEIIGGTQAGNNLFHSFRDFNVRTGETAYFNNALTINNIITRVTGGQLSNINGLIRANGNANLFLLNPNGIIFGLNGQLNIGGSFVASTASSLKFADGIEFSATNPQASALLTVNVPIGLQFGANPGSIINRSQATQVRTDGKETIIGLQVLPERTLALVGGEVSLEGGYLTSAAGSIDLGSVGATLLDNNGNPIDVQQASGGRIEVGAVGANSLVQIAQQPENPQILNLNYQSVNNFQNIQLSKLAVINASGDGGGEIQLQGRRVTIKEGSLIQSNTLGSNPGGTLAVRGTESIEVIGNTLTEGPVDPRLAGAGIIVPRRTSVSTTSFAEGRAGDLIVETGNLILTDGAEVVAFSFGKGRGGDLFVRASKSVEIYNRSILLGFNPALFFPFGFDVPGFDVVSWRYLPIATFIATSGVGNGPAGNISIDTGRLILRNGGTIGANAFFGGDGGTIKVNASDSVEVFGTSEEGIVRSLLWSGATGAGDAGDLVLNTGRLIVGGGASVQVIAFSTGTAGNISINTSKSVEVSGTTSDGQIPSNLSASTFGEGNGGSLTIHTGQLVVRNGGEVAVNSTKTGNAGNLEVVANSVRLADRANINATTTSGEGGNISINVRDYLLLRNGSQITAKAEGTGNGGNITIDPPFIIAVKPENSDIIANALTGKGGNINITATGIYGLVPTRGPLNDSISEINASSQTGIQGNVTINNPEVDPSSGLVKLPEELSDASNQVVVSCAAAQGNSFTITGRGGLPEDPTATIRGQTVWSDLQDFSSVTEGANATPTNNQALTKNRPSRIVEATGWVTDKQGHVTLVAALPNGTASTYGAKPPNCH